MRTHQPGIGVPYGWLEARSLGRGCWFPRWGVPAAGPPCWRVAVATSQLWQGPLVCLPAAAPIRWEGAGPRLVGDPKLEPVPRLGWLGGPTLALEPMGSAL